MSNLLDRFLQATEWGEVMQLACDLDNTGDPADVPALVAALRDPLEARRYGAAYSLGFSRRDGRSIAPLIGVLLDKQETPRVRGQVAECLGYQGRRKCLKALIACSADESAEVRFWCVFALGSYVRRRRQKRGKTNWSVARPLEARLKDSGLPEGRGMGYSVGLEALAMLARHVDERHFATHLYRETMRTALNDPVAYPEYWQWAQCYWDMSNFGPEQEWAELFDAAVRKISDAGFDPASFGRAISPRPSAAPEST
jgi:hypothetical protein